MPVVHTIAQTPPAGVAAVGNVRRIAGHGRIRSACRNGGVSTRPPATTASRHGLRRLARTRRTPLLALAAGDARGVAVALPARRADRGAVRILPVVNPQQPQQRGLYPFFFQDDFRSYFVRPIYADWRPPRLVAMPLVHEAALPGDAAARAPCQTAARRRCRRRRGGGGRREDIEDCRS